MKKENLNFEASRMRGVLNVMEGDRKRFAELEKKYKMLQSEHNILKITYLNLVDGHTDIVVGKNKTIKRLRKQIKDLHELHRMDMELYD